MEETRNLSERIGGYAALPLRIAVAAVFIYTGYKKLIDINTAINSFQHLGIWWPSLTAPLVAVAEFFGGLGILVGVLPRFSAIVLSVVMLQAWYEVYNLGRPFTPNIALNIALLGGTLSIALGGVGRLSLGDLFHKPSLDVESFLVRRLRPHH